MNINGNLKRIFPNVVDPAVASKLYENIEYKKALGKITHYGKRGVDAWYKLMLDQVSSVTTVSGGSTWLNNQAKNEASISQLEATYHKISAGIQTTRDSEAKFELMGGNISEYELKKAITFQAMAQRKAYLTFFGTKNGEGLYNQATTTTTLPQDSNSQSKLSSYVPSELLDFLAEEIRKVQNVSYNMLRPITIVAPIEAINYLKSKIVPLGDFQQKGAGTDTVAGVLGKIVYELNGLQIEFVSCSYLKGRGTGSKDVMLLIARGVEDTNGGDRESTAYLNNVMKDNNINTMMDEALPLTETTNPEINGVKSWFVEHIITAGICLRKEAIRKIEYEY